MCVSFILSFNFLMFGKSNSLSKKSSRDYVLYKQDEIMKTILSKNRTLEWHIFWYSVLWDAYPSYSLGFTGVFLSVSRQFSVRIILCVDLLLMYF